MDVLAIDIGGTHFKFRTEGQTQVTKVASGPGATPQSLVTAINENTVGWKFDHISVGFPAPVVDNRPVLEPANLAKGWLEFDFQRAFRGKPLRMVNDAAMQALGSYAGGRMLFLGLGTGLGSALVVEGIVQPMEIAHLSWKKGKTYEDYLGLRGLQKRGREKWNMQVVKAVSELRAALGCSDVVLGGGNIKLLKTLPDNVRLGSNADAMKGAFMLWKTPEPLKLLR